MRRAAFVLLAAALPAPAMPQGAGAPYVLVEAGQGFPTLQEAVDAIGDRTGTIRVSAGLHRDCAVQSAGRVAFVAAAPGDTIFDGAVCEGKATLVLRGVESRVDGLIFAHTVVPDGNGAGIRMEKGNLTVSNAMFLDGQCGILSATDPAGFISVDHSTFAGLGKDPTGNGAHAIYIGAYGGLRVTASRFERGTGGHYLKSRSPRIEVLDSSFDDSHGHTTNYMIDLSNGATGRIAGNTFVQGPDKENFSTLVTVAPEGVRNPSRGLVVEHNRATLAPGVAHGTTFVGNWSGEPVTVRDNALGARIDAYSEKWIKKFW